MSIYDGKQLAGLPPGSNEDPNAPHADMVRDIKFGGAWFEVGIDCQEPDEPGVVAHPDNYWVECIKLGGLWWGAHDVLSEHMRKCLDEAVQRKIAEEYREAAE